LCAYRTAREPDQIVVNKFIPSRSVLAYIESVTTNAARPSSTAHMRACVCVLARARSASTLETNASRLSITPFCCL
jgi:hypothetical protein